MMKQRYVVPATFIALTLLLTASAMPYAQHQTHSQTTVDPADYTTTKPLAVQTFFGDSKKLGNGMVRSWVRLDKAGNPTSIGVTFTEAALTGLPTDVESEAYDLNLPAQAGETPFNRVGLNWNPKGHEPEHIYTVGHFDFHFYMISPAEREAITLQGESLTTACRKPAGEFVPAQYFYAPGSEMPRMGAHWIDQNAQELHGHHFTTTFIYGSYDGHFIFLEPMITKAFLETKPCFTQTIQLPAKYEKPGYYPTSYSVRYDTQKQEYNIALERLVKR